MKRVITGLFDSRAEAEAVVAHLKQHDGISAGSIRIHGVDATTTTTTATTEDKGFWASLRDVFVADEDRYAYSEGIRRGGFVVSAEVDETLIDHAMDVFEEHGAVDLDSRETEWRKSGWTGYTAQAAAMPTTPAMAGVATTATASTTPTMGVASRVEGEEVIPVVEETLRVGKREIDRGRIRVRSYVVETPVSESITLRNETVSIERRSVDLPLSAADDAFRERTIEAVEHDEEAVVSKDARVREELVIRKDVDQRTETVTDTVRRTEVEVEDDRTAGTTVTGTTVTGTSTTGTRRT